jgi:methionyl-tRNA formyltransferase
MTGRQYNAEPGTILAGAIFPGTNYPDPGVFAVGGDGAALELLEVQLEGRKRMPAVVFANGHRLTNNDRLGS